MYRSGLALNLTTKILEIDQKEVEKAILTHKILALNLQGDTSKMIAKKVNATLAFVNKTINQAKND